MDIEKISLKKLVSYYYDQGKASLSSDDYNIERNEGTIYKITDHLIGNANLELAAALTFEMFNLEESKKNNFNIEKLKLKIPEIVYIYSQNSAISFLNLVKNYRLENLWMNSNLMCIGEKTSAVLNEIKWKKIFLFNSGEEEFLLYKI